MCVEIGLSPVLALKSVCVDKNMILFKKDLRVNELSIKLKLYYLI